MSEIFPRDIIWRAGGLSPGRHGTLTRRLQIAARGGEEALETLVRADATTCATGIGPDGIIRTAAANVPRFEWLDTNGDGILDTPAWLFEGARTNAFTKSQKLDDAAYTKTRCSISVDATTAPDGTTTADKIVEDATAGASHVMQRSPGTLTATTQQSLSPFMKAGERTWVRINTFDKAGVNRNSWVNLATGALGTIDGSHGVIVIPSRGSVAGWYRILLTWPSGSGANTPQVAICLATGDGISTYNGDGASGFYCWGMQPENDQPFPSSYIATDASTVTRALEYATWQLGLYPGQDLTFYLKLWLKSKDTTTQRVLAQLGATSAVARRLVLSLLSGNLDATAVGDSGNVSSTVSLSSFTPPGILEARVSFTAAGLLQLGMAIGGGAESLGSQVGPPVLPAWNSPTIVLNTPDLSTLPGHFSLIDGFLVRGLPSLAECRRVPA